MHRLPKPAGATACEAAELRRALSVNPHDLDGVEETVRRDVHLWAHTARPPSLGALDRGRSSVPYWLPLSCLRGTVWC
jgi:hypothetical protein